MCPIRPKFLEKKIDLFLRKTGSVVQSALCSALGGGVLVCQEPYEEPKCRPLWSPEPGGPKAFLGWQTQKLGHQTQKPGHQTHIKAPLQEILMLLNVTQG